MEVNDVQAVFDAGWLDKVWANEHMKPAEKRLVAWLAAYKMGNPATKLLEEALFQYNLTGFWKAKISLILFADLNRPEIAKILLEFLLKFCSGSDRQIIQKLLDKIKRGEKLTLEDKTAVLEIIYKIFIANQPISNPASGRYDPLILGNYSFHLGLLKEDPDALRQAKEFFELVIRQAKFSTAESNRIFLSIALRFGWKRTWIDNSDHLPQIQRNPGEFQEAAVESLRENQIPAEFNRYQAEAHAKAAQIELYLATKEKDPQKKRERLEQALLYLTAGEKFASDFQLLEIVCLRAAALVEMGESSRLNEAETILQGISVWMEKYRAEMNRKVVNPVLPSWLGQIAAQVKILKSKIYQARGDLLVAQSKLFEAKKMYRKAIEIQDDNYEAWVGLAEVHNWTGDYSLALSEYERVIVGAPKSPAALRAQLGTAEVFLRRKSNPPFESAALLKKIFTEEPPDSPLIPRAVNFMIDSCLAREEEQEKIFQIPYPGVRLYLEMARVHIWHKRFKEAKEVLAKVEIDAIKSDKILQAKYELARLALLVGEEKDPQKTKPAVFAAVKKVFQLVPHDPGLVWEAAKILLDTLTAGGEFKKAAAFAEEAKKSESYFHQSPEEKAAFLLKLGDLYRYQKEDQKARENYAAALGATKNPTLLARAHAGLAELEDRGGNPAQAEEEIARAKVLLPDEPEIERFYQARIEPQITAETKVHHDYVNGSHHATEVQTSLTVQAPLKKGTVVPYFSNQTDVRKSDQTKAEVNTSYAGLKLKTADKKLTVDAKVKIPGSSRFLREDHQGLPQVFRRPDAAFSVTYQGQCVSGTASTELSASDSRLNTYYGNLLYGLNLRLGPEISFYHFIGPNGFQKQTAYGLRLEYDLDLAEIFNIRYNLLKLKLAGVLGNVSQAGGALELNLGDYGILTIGGGGSYQKTGSSTYSSWNTSVYYRLSLSKITEILNQIFR